MIYSIHSLAAFWVVCPCFLFVSASLSQLLRHSSQRQPEAAPSPVYSGPSRTLHSLLCSKLRHLTCWSWGEDANFPLLFLFLLRLLMQLVAGWVAVVTSHSVSLHVEALWSQGRGSAVFWTKGYLNTCLQSVSISCIGHWAGRVLLFHSLLSLPLPRPLTLLFLGVPVSC